MIKRFGFLFDFFVILVPILPEYFYTEHQHETKTSQDLTKNTILPAAETTTTPEYENLTYSTTNENISSNCRSSASNHFLVKENLYIGLLFASKPLVQSFANLAVGPVVDRIGFDFPMLFGNMVMMASGLSKLLRIEKCPGVLTFTRLQYIRLLVTLK